MNWRDYLDDDRKEFIEGPFRESLVDFPTFVESKDFCHDDGLSDVQYYEVERGIGKDPQKIFTAERIPREIVWLWGKGCVDSKTIIKDVETKEEHTIEQWANFNKKFTVYSLDEQTNQIVKAKTGVPFLKGEDDLYEVKLDTGKVQRKIVVTKEHKFMTSSREWKKLKDLQVGDELIFFGGDKSYMYTDSYQKVHRRGCEDGWKKDTGRRAKLVAENGKKLSARLTKKERRELFGNQGKKHPRWGKRWVDKDKEKISKGIKNSTKWKGWLKSEERKEQLKKFGLEHRGENSSQFGKPPHPGSGRCKWYTYSSPIAGIVRLQGTYEYRFAQLLDKIGVQWERGKKFEYILDDNTHTYFPDFKVTFDNGYVCYYETKGYIQDIDFIKLEAVRNQGHPIVLVDEGLLNHFEKFHQLTRNGVKLSIRRIVSIEKVGTGKFYDFEVPKYHNYFLRGFLNHNSGKGTSSSLLGLYLFYILLCMKDCHGYFGVSKADPLSFVNVALSGQQAQRFFEKFTNRLKANKWFKKYKMVDQGKVISGSGHEFPFEEISITTSKVDFPQALDAISLHSQNEKWEDLTLFGFVCDEISGFKTDKGIYNGEEILKTLKYSTRELPYLGIITSFPRLDEDTDLCFKKYKEATDEQKQKGDNARIIGSKYYTWQVKPARFYSGQTFKFLLNERSGETVDVPIEYLDKVTDPETFKTKMMCIPGAGIGDFFQYPSHLNNIQRCTPLFETIDEFIEYGEKKRIRKRILHLPRDKSIPRIITLDCGRSQSEATLAVCHKEVVIIKDKQGITHKIGAVVIDAMIVWTPNEREGIVVDIQNYQDIIIELFQNLNIYLVRMDQWNAAAIESNLSNEGIRCEIKNATYESYTKMRTSVYAGGLIMADQCETSFDNDGKVIDINCVDQFIKQCKVLKTHSTQKPRVEFGRQDITDVVAHACDILATGVEEEDSSVIGVGVNMLMSGQQMISQQRREEIEQSFGFKRRTSNQSRKIPDTSADDLAVII